MEEERFSEAADFFRRAAAIEPKEAVRWVDLGWAHQKGKAPEEARAALDRARNLDPPDWLKVRAGFVYQALGDAGKAGELADIASASLSSRLAGLSAEGYAEGDIYWVDRLAEAWYLLGSAAQASGDLGKAERYLDAAWKLTFLPDAAWALGDLREKQGRLSDALDLQVLASQAPTAAQRLPSDYLARIEAAAHRLSGHAGPPATSLPAALPNATPPRGTLARTLMDLRIVRLKGPVLADLSEEVLLLVGADGRVERARNLSKKDASAFDRQLARLGPLQIPIGRPDDRAFKSVRRGLLVCARVTDCSLVLDLPGLAGLSASVASAESLGSIEIAELDPPDGAKLQRGQSVKVVAVVRYDLRAARGSVTLVIQDQEAHSLVVPQAITTVERGAGKATLSSSFTVPANATRIDLFLPLNGPEKAATRTVTSAHYTVPD
jgi:tetratricopeptide (TPR) repeat protein